MSRRERPARRLTDAAPKPPRSHAAPVGSSVAAAAPVSDRSNWDKFFHDATPGQRAELLALARSQGLLYSFQLPATSNGAHAEHAPESLLRILGGKIDTMTPVYPESVEVRDAELDCAQRDAVARALQTPDVCLIQGFAGTGKSRVITEIIAQLAGRGQRVLFVAPTAEALDRVLERLAGSETVCALRCLGPDEANESIPEAVRPMTLASQEQFLRTEAIARAHRRVAANEQKFARLQRLAEVWLRLEDATHHVRTLTEEQRAIAEQGAALPASIEALARAAPESAAQDAFNASVTECTRSRDEAFSRIDQQSGTLQEQAGSAARTLQDVEQQVQRLAPLIVAWKANRFWTGAWWQALMTPGFGRDANALEKRGTELHDELTQLRAKIDSLQEDRDRVQASYHAERNSLIAAEVTRRRTELDTIQREVLQKLETVDAVWQAAAEHVRPETETHLECTAASVSVAVAGWRRQVELAEQATELSRQWAGYLEQSHEAISARLPVYVNVLAITTAAFAAGKHLDEGVHHGAGRDAAFDHLVLDEAYQIAEPELLSIAGHARHWILVGQPAWPASASSALGTTGDGPDIVASARRLKAPFQRLWQVLHCSPRALPYTWLLTKDRLCCRLLRIRPDQQQWLEKECVADSPEIELRILSLPDGRPVLAEILFPPPFSCALAKQYVYRELQELAIATAAHTLRWSERPGCVTLAFDHEAVADATVVLLEPGIREFVVPVHTGSNGDGAWHTVKIEFDVRSGWNRQRAAEWVTRHVGLRDLGRTASLDVLHRMERDVGGFLRTIFADTTPRPQGEPGRPALPLSGAAVQFVPVPPASSEDDGRSRERPEPGAFSRPNRLSRKGGAGLELDLSDPRQRDRIPADLRGHLPREGIVNLLEAQAIVRTLSMLAGEAASGSFGSSGSDQHGARVDVAVLALYPAQAELISRLIERAPVLASAPFKIEVGVPARFRQRETCIVLVSLTRSHTHRAVAYGHDPQMLALALTRARARIVLFGDPGTLVRRSQWDGPLEQLDAVAAGQERHLISQLVHYLDGHGRMPRTLQPGQGSAP